MLQALELVGTERVLDVGWSSPYVAALLSQLAAEVYTVVDTSELVAPREEELSALGCSNVHVVSAEACEGWPTSAPYQAILVGGAASEVPLPLLDQLDLGGRLVVPIGDAEGQLLERLLKRRGAVESETLGACHLGLLTGAQASPPSFPWTRR